VTALTGAGVAATASCPRIARTSDSYGIRLSQSSPRASIVGNRVVNFRNGIFFTFGGSGVYMDNTVGGATVPFTGGTAAGATNFTF
jgi:hypothetical protein